MNILVTGANGFVGKSLIPRLVQDGHKVVALVRGHAKSKKKNSHVHWIEGDLLDPAHLPKLEKIDHAFYLVHGLKSGEGDFEHDEAMGAVNFINWVRPHSPQVIYLGGLAPHEGQLSPHLRSRVLTGAILGASGLPTLELRASIVLGEESTSFEMIKALSERLPFRPELSLLNRPCQPLGVTDLLDYLVAALELPLEGSRIVEIGGPEVTTYGDLLDLYSELKGLKRKHLKLPEVEPKVLMKALDYVLPEHADVGRKLVETMGHATVVKDMSASKLFSAIRPMAPRVAMDMALSASKSHYPPLWEKDFLRNLLSDKILTQSGLLSPELLKNLEKLGKLKDILSRK